MIHVLTNNLKIYKKFAPCFGTSPTKKNGGSKLPPHYFQFVFGSTTSFKELSILYYLFDYIQKCDVNLDLGMVFRISSHVPPPLVNLLGKGNIMYQNDVES